jgi:hypothetical protein
MYDNNNHYTFPVRRLGVHHAMYGCSNSGMCMGMHANTQVGALVREVTPCTHSLLICCSELYIWIIYGAWKHRVACFATIVPFENLKILPAHCIFGKGSTLRFESGACHIQPLPNSTHLASTYLVGESSYPKKHRAQGPKSPLKVIS